MSVETLRSWEISEPWYSCQAELCTGNGKQNKRDTQYRYHSTEIAGGVSGLLTDSRHDAIGLGICPAWFQSCLVFPPYAQTLCIRMAMYILCNMLEVYNLLFDFIGITVRGWLEFQKTLNF